MGKHKHADVDIHAVVEYERERAERALTASRLPLEELITATDRLYRILHPLGGHERPYVDVPEEWDEYTALQQELRGRIREMPTVAMLSLQKALESGDPLALDAAAEEFRALPPLARAWAFWAWDPDCDSYFGGDIEPEGWLPSAVERRRLARAYDEGKGGEA